MNFELPSLKAGAEEKTDLGLRSGTYGVHDTFLFGLATVKNNLEPCHPLELSEKNFVANEEKMQMNLLRNNQGLHAPIKLAAELRATRAVGRLPFLESSGLSAATIKSSDDYIDFGDFLNLPEQDERFFVPHIVMEHHLGIL
ncbi:hypothetical protein O3M35_007156 [Rhynocoris fuscipes]|uniref:Proteasome maturation protein n=1 Tax=Rhynocoris fuscipes TaxID=488301 RepID=A0AAW1D8G4_9HEMI